MALWCKYKQYWSLPCPKLWCKKYLQALLLCETSSSLVNISSTYDCYVHELVYNAAALVESVSWLSATGIENLLVNFWNAQLSLLFTLCSHCHDIHPIKTLPNVFIVQFSIFMTQCSVLYTVSHSFLPLELLVHFWKAQLRNKSLSDTSKTLPMYL